MKRAVKKEVRKKKVGKWLYWTPRVLSVLFILFIAMFSLDVFDPSNNYTIWQTLLALFMHNIITFILIIFLVVAWKREWLGALGFLLFGVWYIGTVVWRALERFEWYYFSWILTIAFPALIISYLWWLNWKRK